MMLGLLTQLAATATFATPPHLRLAERPTWTLTGDGSPAVRVSNLSLPSLVQLDLHEAGLIGSPLHGNALDDGSLRWIHDAGRNWTYSTVFTAPVSVHGLLLVAQSLDTLATVRLNGAVVGTSTNMHVQLALELPATVLRPGTENVLAISFGDPVSYSIAQHAAHPCSSCKFNATQYPIYSWAQGRPWIRKTQSHYGWNWGPAGMPYGVPRDIFLVELSKLLLEDMRVSMMPAAARRADQLPLLPTERLEDNATDFEVTLELRVRSVLPAPAGTALLVTAGWDESGVPQTVHLPALPRGVSTVTVTLELHHTDAALCVPLLVAHNLDDIAADWRSWAEHYALPMLMVEADGVARPLDDGSADQPANGQARRRRHSQIADRRPRFLVRRSTGKLGIRMRIEGREIIARR